MAKVYKNIHKPSCHAHRRIHAIQLTATAHLLKYLFVCAFKKQEFHIPHIHTKKPNYENNNRINSSKKETQTRGNCIPDTNNRIHSYRNTQIQFSYKPTNSYAEREIYLYI